MNEAKASIILDWKENIYYISFYLCFAINIQLLAFSSFFYFFQIYYLNHRSFV